MRSNDIVYIAVSVDLDQRPN